MGDLGRRPVRLLLKLYASFLLVAVVGALAAGVLVDVAVRRASAASIESELDAEATMLGQITASALFGELDPSDTSLQDSVRALGGAVRTHLSLLAPSGEVVADSEVTDLATLAREPTPEIERARAAGVGAAVRGVGASEQLHVARAIVRDGTLLGFARASIPMSAVREEAMTVRWRVAFGALAAVGVALLLGLVVSLGIVRPLRAVVVAARALEKGLAPPELDATRTDEIGEVARAFNTMRDAVVFREERLKEEMNLAQRIQTAILPRSFDVDGYDVSGEMIPATEVGGDYYDVLPMSDGCWLAMGDVAGHGLNAGLIMLMTQTAVASLVDVDSEASPRKILRHVNAVLASNIRTRLRRDEHVTMVVMRCRRDGSVTFAGAHEDLLVYRARTSEVETIATRGTWTGVHARFGDRNEDLTFQLEENDVMLLYTDGVIEARDGDGRMFGIDRLRAGLARDAHEPIETIRRRLIEEVVTWTAKQVDDVSLLVVKRRGTR